MISRWDNRRFSRIVTRGAGFSPIEFGKGRRRKRLAGIILFWGGLALLVLDMTTSFPTPVRGQYAAWWLPVMAAGTGLWLLAKRLPLEEAIIVAKYCRGELTVTDLTGELNVTIGTAERILEALGININMAPEQVRQCLDDIGITFLFAQRFHPAMKYAMPARKQMAAKTIFNFIGPLSNPASATHQLIGVYDSQ